MNNSTIQSFTLDVSPTKENTSKAEKACENRLNELQVIADVHNKKIIEENEENKIKGIKKSSAMLYLPDLSYEVISAMDNIRINLYGATAKDIFQIGQNFSLIMRNAK